MIKKIIKVIEHLNSTKNQSNQQLSNNNSSNNNNGNELQLLDGKSNKISYKK